MMSDLPRQQNRSMIRGVVSSDIIECMIESAKSKYNSARLPVKSQDGKSYIPNPLLQYSNHTSETGSETEGYSRSYTEAATEVEFGSVGKIGLLDSMYWNIAPALALSLFTVTSQVELSSFGLPESGSTQEQSNEQNAENQNISDNKEDSKTMSNRPAEPDNDHSSLPKTVNDNRGLIYARVSSKQQNSAEDQIARLREDAEKREKELLESHSPIKDEGKTGMNFERPGIQKVTRLAQEGAFSYLFVDDIDRVGRHAPEAIYYLYHLRKQGVTIITHEGGELDINEIESLMVAFMTTISSQWENETRARRAKEGRVEEYKQKNWDAAFKQVPLGYEKHGNWITINDKEADLIRRAVDFFLATKVEGAYKRTVEEVGLDSRGLSSRQLKTLLEKPVYHGEPTYRRESDGPCKSNEEPVVIEDESLEIISEQRFERVQEKIDEISERYSGGRSSSSDVDDYVAQFGLDAVVSAAECVELRCPRPGCDAELVKNGKRMTDGERVHNYICTNGHQRKFAQKRDLERMKNFSEESEEDGEGEEDEEGSHD